MTIPEFNANELNIVGEVPCAFGYVLPVYNFPVSMKEAQRAAFSKKPYWQTTGVEIRNFAPKVHPENVARASVFDGTNTPQTGGTDMFGIEWEFIPQAGGSMVRPGKPFIEDANELKDKIVWPDIEAWDWEASVEANKEYLNTNAYVRCWIFNGWYERLIALMDFEGAILAMIDEDQMDAIKEFFDKLSFLYIRIIEKYLTCFPQIDGFLIHDDWGSQKETFFSPATVEEMIVPYMRRVTDFIHSKGRFCELHSCGQILKQVPNIIAAGWDAWNPQPMNDTHKIHELYGDQLLVGVVPEMFDPQTTTEEEQRAAAKKFADQFCRPEKPSMFNISGTSLLTPAYSEELYKQSRINYAK